MKKLLASLFREYINDFITVEAFARYHSFGKYQAERIIKLGRKLHELGY